MPRCEMLLLSSLFDNFSLRHCPHAVFTTLGNNKSERNEGKTRKINFGVLFTVAFTSTQYSTIYLIIRAGQFWVIISDFFLQLNLCMRYRENHFRPITDLCRTLLTPARSHIWRVNKLTSKKSCMNLSKLPRAHNKHVPWFHDPMLSK